MHIIVHVCLLVGTTLSVSGALQPVKDFTCVIYAYFQFNCSYILPAEYPLNAPGYITYSIDGQKGKLCHQGADRSFRVEEPAIFSNFTFIVEVVDTSTVFNLTSRAEFRVHWADIFLPSKVRALKVTEVTTSSISLSWEAVDEYVYEITCLSITYQVASEKKHVQYNSTVKLSGLTPGVMYRVSVRQKLVERGKPCGYWSETTSLPVSTLEDVPDEGPIVSKAVARPAANQIVIYWKPLSRNVSHGKLEGYQIMWEDTGAEISASVKASRTCYMITHISSYSCNIRVMALNKMGTSPPSFITVQAPDQEPSVPMFWATGRDTHVTYRWNTITHRPARCTLYWCSASSKRPICEVPIEWHSVRCEDLKSTITVNTSVVNKPMVGMSVEIEMNGRPLHSQVMWQNCIHDDDKGIQKIEDFRVTLAEDDVAYLEWNKPRCDGPIITHIIVQHCMLEDHRCSNQPNSISISDDSTNILIRDLLSDRTYMFNIRAVSGSKRGPLSSQVVFIKPGVSHSLTISTIGVFLIVIVVCFVCVLLYQRGTFTNFCRESVEVPPDAPDTLNNTSISYASLKQTKETLTDASSSTDNLREGSQSNNSTSTSHIPVIDQSEPEQPPQNSDNALNTSTTSNAINSSKAMSYSVIGIGQSEPQDVLVDLPITVGMDGLQTLEEESMPLVDNSEALVQNVDYVMQCNS